MSPTNGTQRKRLVRETTITAKCQIRSYTSKRPFAVINDATSFSNAQFLNVVCHVSNLILTGWEKTLITLTKQLKLTIPIIA